jgi:hypothetical protein
MNTEKPAVRAEFVQFNTTLVTSFVTLHYIVNSLAVVENVVEVRNVYFLYKNV